MTKTDEYESLFPHSVKSVSRRQHRCVTRQAGGCSGYEDATVVTDDDVVARVAEMLIRCRTRDHGDGEDETPLISSALIDKIRIRSTIQLVGLRLS
jgi:hypothetical protein